MTRAVLAILTLLFAGAMGLSAAPGSAQQPAAAAIRFEAVDVFVDSGAEPLSAYQFELTAPAAEGFEARIVGVEGGEHEAYRQAPYYDAAALQHNRIIIAAYSLAEALPTGRTRVARLHMELRPLETARRAGAKDKALVENDEPAKLQAGAQTRERAEAAPKAASEPLSISKAVTGKAVSYTAHLVTVASRDGKPTSATVSLAIPTPESIKPPAATPGGNP